MYKRQLLDTFVPVLIKSTGKELVSPKTYAGKLYSLISPNFRYIALQSHEKTRASSNSISSDTESKLDELTPVSYTHLDVYKRQHFDLLEEGQQYTFAEMLQLWHAPQQYVQLYVKLTPLAVDQRLLTIRQLLKHALLDTALSENEERMEQLTRCLLQETFDRWYRDEFAHIRGLKRRTAVQLLEHYDEVQRFVPDFQTESDAVFAVHNACLLYTSRCV